MIKGNPEDLLAGMEEIPASAELAPPSQELPQGLESEAGAENFPEPPLPPSPVADERALEALAELRDRLEDLNTSFETKIKYDSAKEKVIDELHRQLQSYREDLVFKLLRPMFMDLIAMHDDMSSILAHWATTDNADPAFLNMVDNLRSFQATLEEILARNGVEVYSEPGDEYVAGRQRATRVVPTEQHELDLKVAERRGMGFGYGSRVLRPETVGIYRCAIAQVSGQTNAGKE